jgi:hypothetical protein
MSLKLLSLLALGAVVGSVALSAAPDVSSSFSKLYDHELSSLESEFVPLVEAMPSDKLAFIPTGGVFDKSRSFAQQASHVATVLYEVSAAILKQKSPVPLGTNENGVLADTSKEALVKYVKDAFAYAHKSVEAITAENILEPVPSPFGKNPVSRAYLADVLSWHSYDHYGQMVIYARLNKIVPPASR